MSNIKSIQDYKNKLYESTGELISIENVSLNYYSSSGEINALENINFNIFPGEFVCLLGPSGCGKSTLLKIIAGFIKPTSGVIKMDAKIIKGIDWNRGVIFQQPPLYEWLSVEQNIEFGLKMRRIPKMQRKEEIKKIINKIELGEFSSKKIYELSGGMKQRVAIARALINNPRVLLMDEPYGALDALTREKMQDMLRKIWWETGKTILFITHDVDEALSLGTRILVMSKRPGKVIKEFDVNFTKNYITYNLSLSDIRYSEKFREIRENILDLINSQ